MTLKYEFKGLCRVISGGQTGADQGGLIAAAKAGVETGGTAPLHYKTQDGLNPLLSLLGLTNAGDYTSRTIQNVQDSDGTVIIGANTTSPGSALTKQASLNAGKPYLVLNIREIVEPLIQGAGSEKAITELLLQHGQRLKDFIEHHQIKILNVAGNREIRGTTGNAVLPITTTAEWIVAVSLELLDLDDHLIRSKTPPVEL